MQENKHISTGLAIAACALSLAVHAADNDWQVSSGEGASTEWSNPANWSLSLDDTSNGLRFREGSGVLDRDVTVTFADAYEYPNYLKFENISTLDGSGLVTFRGNTDESGLSITSGNNILVGWYGSGGYRGNVEFAKGSYSMDNALLVQHGCATISGASLYCGGNLHLGYGDAAETTLNIFGGSVSCNGFYIGDKSGNKATCVMTNGTLTSRATGDSAAFIGQNGQGEFFFYGGKADFNGQFQIGRYNGSSGLFVITNGEFSVASYTCIGYNSGSGKFIMDGGTFTDRGGVFIVGQGSNASATGECIVSNGVLNVQSMYISENNTCGTLTVEGGEVNVNGTVLLIRNDKSQVATVNLNGGVLSTERFDLGGGGQSGNSAVINFNGGTLKGVRSTSNAFIPNLGRLTVKLGEKGAIFDTAGFDLTVADTLDNADGLDHNAPIAKKGLGTLTISSSLDLNRTFKFVIDGGVGPIALTGEDNSLGEDKKISVALDPVDALTNTTYVLMTGIDTSYTKEDNFVLPSNNGFYAYTWTLENGELSVALGYVEGAPVTAEYSAANETWEYYNASHEILQGASGSAFTSYVFCGNEPDGAFGSISASHSVILRSGTISVSSPVSAGIVTVPAESTAVLSGGEGASFKAKRLVNNGTLTFAGTISVDSLEQPGAVAIADGARVELSRPQTIAAAITGSGTLALSGGKFTCSSAGVFGAYDGASRFDGTIEVGAGTQLDSAMVGENVRLGRAVVRLTGGSTVYLGGDNGSRCSNNFDIAGTGNVIYATKANMFMSGAFTGIGEVVVRTDGKRGPRPSGDNSQFAGVFTLRNVDSQGDTGFHGANATSAAGKWIIDTDNNNRIVDFADAQNGTFHVGELYQSVASTSLRVTTTGTGIVVGERSGGESVINGHFTGNAFSFTKLGADSWLTLGQGFAAAAGSTFNFSAGGICFNLPAGETEPTSLIGHTVTFDPSVKIRVAMTQAQFEALDLNEEYLVAKLPTNPGYKPETELLVDGTVLDTPAAAKWCVRFKSFPAVGETPAYVGAVLCRKTRGLIIMFK
ncbi:MAG: hypothetical protein E7049_06175 [Lentisphaerae bacterium]|nr:hypothetical protein [Lentisphaerota bacterium]